MTKNADLFSAGDNLKDWIWKGPESKEVAELALLKNDFEIKEGIKLSKEGLVSFIDDVMAKEKPVVSG